MLGDLNPLIKQQVGEEFSKIERRKPDDTREKADFEKKLKERDPKKTADKPVSLFDLPQKSKVKERQPATKHSSSSSKSSSSASKRPSLKEGESKDSHESIFGFDEESAFPTEEFEPPVSEQPMPEEVEKSPFDEPIEHQEEHKEVGKEIGKETGKETGKEDRKTEHSHLEKRVVEHSLTGDKEPVKRVKSSKETLKSSSPDKKSEKGAARLGSRIEGREKPEGFEHKEVADQSLGSKEFAEPEQFIQEEQPAEMEEEFFFELDLSDTEVEKNVGSYLSTLGYLKPDKKDKEEPVAKQQESFAPAKEEPKEQMVSSSQPQDAANEPKSPQEMIQKSHVIRSGEQQVVHAQTQSPEKMKKSEKSSESETTGSTVKKEKTKGTSRFEASKSEEKEGAPVVNPSIQSIGLHIETSAESTPIDRSAIIKELVQQIVDRVQVMRKDNQTHTIITLRHPPILKDATITLISSDHAKRELNISFGNLSPEAKQFLDLQLKENSLTAALQNKGIIAHMITTTTQPTTPLIPKENAPTPRDREEGQEKKQDRGENSEEDDTF